MTLLPLFYFVLQLLAGATFGASIPSEEQNIPSCNCDTTPSTGVIFGASIPSTKQNIPSSNCDNLREVGDPPGVYFT